MINRVNYFRIQFRFRRNIQIFIKLLGGHHAVCITPQSHEKKYLKNRNSAVCIKPWSQTAHCGVRIDIFESLSLLLKRQSGKILLWVNKSIMKEKIWRTIFWFAKPKILTLWCHAHQSRIFRTLRSTISDKSKLNLKILYPVHQGPIWVRIMKKMEVENLVTHSI